MSFEPLTIVAACGTCPTRLRVMDDAVRYELGVGVLVLTKDLARDDWGLKDVAS